MNWTILASENCCIENVQQNIIRTNKKINMKCKGYGENGNEGTDYWSPICVVDEDLPSIRKEIPKSED